MSEEFEPLVTHGQLICEVSDLEEAGQGFRFQLATRDIVPFEGLLDEPDELLPAFVILFDGGIYAYLNRCDHIPMEMDWNPGQFFDDDQQHIICSTHNALYLPDSGQCVLGPCPKGSKLIAVPIDVVGQKIYLR